MYRTGTYTGIEMPTFHTSLNTNHVLADFGQYRPVLSVPADIEKKLFLFIYFSFVIF